MPPHRVGIANGENMYRSKELIPHVRFAPLDSIRIDQDRQHALTATKATLWQLMARLILGIAARAREESFSRTAVLLSASFVLLGRVNSTKLRLPA
jgi:hypothetical protein